MEHTKHLILVLIFLIRLGHAQSILQQDFLAPFRAPYTSLNPNNIPTRILYDKVMPLSGIKDFDGISNTAVASRGNWIQLYFEIKKGSVSLIPSLPELSEIIDNADEIVKQGIVPLAILNVDYNTIDADAVLDGRMFFNTATEKFFDNPSTTQSPYDLKKVFASTVLEVNSIPLNTDFWISDQFYFTNAPSNVSHLEVDFDDGNGIQLISLGAGDVTPVSYPDSGEKTIRLSVIFIDNTKLESNFKVKVLPAPAGNSLCPNILSGTPPVPDVTFNISSTIPYTPAQDDPLGDGGGAFASATVSIIYAPGNNKLTKPFLLLDGFDPVAPIINDQSRHYPQLAELLCQSGSLDFLRDECYDIVFVDWDDGDGYIQKNAFVLVELLQKINNELLEENSGMFVVGPSMGGMISKYALTYMEANGIVHNVSTWVPYDSPHEGANIPLGVQYLLFATRNIIGEMEVLLKGLNSPASRQLLVYHYLNSTTGQPMHNPLRDQLLLELSNLGGFPKNTFRIGISNGSGTGVSQKNLFGIAMNPRDILIDIDVEIDEPDLGLSGTIFGNVKAVPNQTPLTNVLDIRGDLTKTVVLESGASWDIDILLPITKVSIENTKPYDNSPGGFIVDMLALPLFVSGLSVPQPFFSHIPAISSLALRPSQVNDVFYNIKSDPNILKKTFFDIILFADGDNEPHSSISISERDFLLSKVNTLFIQNKVFDRFGLIQANDILTAGKNVDVSQLKGPVFIASGANVEFTAVNKIILKDGFKAQNGSFFHAFITPSSCTPTPLYMTISQEYPPIVNVQHNNNDPENEDDDKGSNKTDVFYSYPNPLSGASTIMYSINQDALVTLSVYNAFGQEVKRLVDKFQESGEYRVTFDASYLDAGTYIYFLKTGEEHTSARMTIIR